MKKHSDSEKKTTFNGDLVAKPGEVYLFTEITGSLYASGADTKTSFPKLTSVGGYLDASGDYGHVKTEDKTAGSRCRALLLASFLASGFSFADGVLAKIVATRGAVSRVIVCGKVEVSYLVTDGDSYSHGATLKEARDGLLFKIGSRDTTEFKAWKLDTMISLRDGIRAYRAITGACEGGVRNWMQSHQVPDKFSVAEAIKFTTGAYGSKEFAGFFNNKPEGK